MRIAFTGSGGTGKSTLVEIISKELNYPIIYEYAREACTVLGLKEPKDLSENQVDEFQKIIFEYKSNEESKNKSFIADRTIVDGLAYHLLRFSNKEISQIKLKKYIKNMKNMMVNYDIVFFLEWGIFPIQDDKFRICRPDKQLTIHFLLKGILNDFNIPYLSLSHNNLQDRINFVKEKIKEYKK